jgi:hypothetical protein
MSICAIKRYVLKIADITSPTPILNLRIIGSSLVCQLVDYGHPSEE